MGSSVVICALCCYLRREIFLKRNEERYGDVFIGSKMLKFQNKRVRKRWIMGNGVVSCVSLGPLYIEPSM